MTRTKVVNKTKPICKYSNRDSFEQNGVTFIDSDIKSIVTLMVVSLISSI